MALLVRTVGRIQQPRACAHWELGPQWQVALLAGKHARDAAVTEKPKQARSWGRHAQTQRWWRRNGRDECGRAMNLSTRKMFAGQLEFRRDRAQVHSSHRPGT